MHTRIYKCAVMRWAHLQMRCANLQMRLHLNCENGRCRPLRRFPRHAAISPRQQGTMRRVSALTFTNARFAHFYAQKGPFPKPQVERELFIHLEGLETGRPQRPSPFYLLLISLFNIPLHPHACSESSPELDMRNNNNAKYRGYKLSALDPLGSSSTSNVKNLPN